MHTCSKSLNNVKVHTSILSTFNRQLSLKVSVNVKLVFNKHLCTCINKS